MCLSVQMFEILGWFFVTISPTFALLISIFSKRTIFLFLITSFGLLFGSILLYFSKIYGIFSFFFIILYLVRLIGFKIIEERSKKYYFWIILCEILFIIIFIFFGIHFQTEIWLLSAILFLFSEILVFFHGIILASKSETYDVNSLELFNTFLPGLLVPFISILFLFDFGNLYTPILSTFYGILIAGFFALLGIVAMFGTFILDKIKINKEYLNMLFKGLIVLYIIAILVLTFGLITLNKYCDKDVAIDLSISTLIPDIPLEERHIDTNQIFGKIIFTAAWGFLFSSLAYLFQLVSELTKELLKSEHQS